MTIACRSLGRTCCLQALMLGLLLSHLAAGFSHAGDWPQILGPRRNGDALNEAAIQPWPESGPTTRWTYPLGQGYAGPAVLGERVVVFHRVGDSERVEALHKVTGQLIWKADFPATYRGGINPDLGPRCVPLIHEGRVYVFGAAGDLHCVDLADGRKRWSRAAYEEYQGAEGYFGAGSTPIIASGKLIVNVGGKGAGLVAFDPQTGKTLWKGTDEGASYSSPSLATIGGQEHVVFVTRLNAVSIDPANGRVRFSFPFGARGPTVNAATPLLFDQYLFVSASYGVGANLSRITGNSAQKVWANDESMSSQYSTCVYYDGHLYGTHGREDHHTGELRCIEAQTGKVRWRVPEIGVAHVIRVGDQLLLLGVNGQLTLARANPSEYEELCRAEISPTVTRSLPALSDGRLYVRDNDGPGGQLKCFEFPRLTPQQE